MLAATEQYDRLTRYLDSPSERVLQITVTCLRQIYNAVGYNTSSNNGNKIGVTAYNEEYVNNQDLQQFLKLEDPKVYGANYTFVSINGVVISYSDIDRLPNNYQVA